MVGGFGVINGGYFCCGLFSDFDCVLILGWVWFDVLEYFWVIEIDLDFEMFVYGCSGFILVCCIYEMIGIIESFMVVVEDVGFVWIVDFNDVGLEMFLGVGVVLFNIVNGVCISLVVGYLMFVLGWLNLILLVWMWVVWLCFFVIIVVGVDVIGLGGLVSLSVD